MQTIGWLTAVLSIAGVCLNIKRKRSCFAVWMLTNAMWTVIDYQAGLYAQSVLFLIYFVLAVWGWWEWRPSK